jgi:hypothetical protein
MMHKPPHRGTGLTRRQLLHGAVGGAAGLVAWRWPWRVWVAVSGLGQVPQFAYAGPYEDIQLKT